MRMPFATLVLIVGPVAVATTTLPASSPVPFVLSSKKAVPGHRAPQPNLSYSEYLAGEQVDQSPAPAPSADAETPEEHGPSAETAPIPVRHTSAAVLKRVGTNFNFTCYFEIRDDDGNPWDFTYLAKLWNPSDGLIAQASSWKAGVSSYGTNLQRDIADPAEGTYKCTVDWWVYSTYVGQQRQATVNVSYPIPTGETTLTNAWLGLIPTLYKWRGRLTGGGNYIGRKVKEEEGGNDVDTCWWSGSQYPQATGLTGGEWDIDSNMEYGDDSVGWMPDVITYYRNQLRAPCQSETDQRMLANRPGSDWVHYKTNRLKAGFTNTTVWSYRDGQQQSKNH